MYFILLLLGPKYLYTCVVCIYIYIYILLYIYTHTHIIVANDQTKDILFKMNKNNWNQGKKPSKHQLIISHWAKIMRKSYCKKNIWVQTWFDYLSNANTCLSVWILCGVIHVTFRYLPVPPSGRFCFSAVN